MADANDLSNNEVINERSAARNMIMSLLGLSDSIPDVSDNINTSEDFLRHIFRPLDISNNIIGSRLSRSAPPSSHYMSNRRLRRRPLPTGGGRHFRYGGMVNPLYTHPTIGSTDSDTINTVDNEFSNFVNRLIGLQSNNSANLSHILRHSLMDPSQNIYKTVLSDDGEKSIEYCKYSREKYPNDTVCSMTLCEFQEGVDIAKLPCDHIFEKEAILKWLKDENASCPVCRKPLESKEVKKINKVPTRHTQVVRRRASNQILRNLIDNQIRREEEEELQAAIMASLIDAQAPADPEEID